MGSATFLRLGIVLTLADFSAVLIFVCGQGCTHR